MDTLGQTQAFAMFHPAHKEMRFKFQKGGVQQCFSLRKEAFMCRLWCRRQAVQLLPLSPVEAQLIVSL